MRPGHELDGSGLRRGVQALEWVVVPTVLAFVLVVTVIGGDATDFDTNVWLPAHAVRAGRSPYPPPEIGVLIEPTFLYPPLLLGLDLVLSLLPRGGARGLFWALELASVLGAMRLLGARDRRVYLWAGLSYPVWVGQLLGNPTLLLLLPLAAAWRWRDSWWAVGVAVGVVGAFKLILWPLGLWLIVTRRFAGAGIAALSAIVLVLVPWAAIGFDGLADYTTSLRIFSERSGAPRAFTLSTLLTQLGAGATVANALRWAGGAAMLAALVLVARRAEGDRRAFSLAIATVLVISPVVERVYLATLLIPLVIARPRFGGGGWQALRLLWLVPLLPGGPLLTVVEDGRVLRSHGFVPTVAQLLVALSLIAVVIVTTAGPPGRWPHRGRRRAVEPPAFSLPARP